MQRLDKEKGCRWIPGVKMKCTRGLVSVQPEQCQGSKSKISEEWSGTLRWLSEAKCGARIALCLAFRSLETRAKVISEGLVVTVRSSITVGCGNKMEALRKSQSFKKFALKIKWERGWSFDAQKDSLCYSWFFHMEKFPERIWRKKVFIFGWHNSM